MLEALWSAEFSSNQGNIGAGIAVFETGRVLGGDGGFMYVGNYRVENGTAHAELKVTKYSDIGNIQSIFGPLNQFNLTVSGPANSQSMVLKGHMIENPSFQITIKAVRRVELP